MGKRKIRAALSELPDDSDTEDDAGQVSLLNNILNVKEGEVEYPKVKIAIYASILAFLLFLPFVDRVIELSLPIADSWLFLIGIKTIMFFVLFFVLLTLLERA